MLLGLQAINPKRKVNKETMEMKMKTAPRHVLYTCISIHESDYSEVEYPMPNIM